MKALTLIGLSAIPGLLWTGGTLVLSGPSHPPQSRAPIQQGPIHQQFARAASADEAYRLSLLAMAQKDPVGYDLADQLRSFCAYARNRTPPASDDGQRALTRLRRYCRSLRPPDGLPPGLAEQGKAALLRAALAESRARRGCPDAVALARVVAGLSLDPFEVRSAVRFLLDSPCGRPASGNGGHTPRPVASLAIEIAYCEVSGFCGADAPYTLYVCLQRSACRSGEGLLPMLATTQADATYDQARVVWRRLRGAGS